MRKAVLGSAIGFGAVALLAAGGVTPLHVKPGLWESTMTITTSGLPPIPPEAAARLTPEQRARMEAAKGSMAGHPTVTTNQHCVTADQLSSDPFKPRNQDKRWKCDETVVNSTGSSLEVHESCSGTDSKLDAHVAIQALDSEHVKGTSDGEITAGGHTMRSHTTFTSKWLSASCPAEK